MVSSLHKLFAFLCTTSVLLASCTESKEHTAPPIYERDSVSLMVSYGVNTLISDSGLIKYRIVAERWDVNQIKRPSRWTFEKGLFMEQFDDSLKVQAYIQADSAWYYDQKKLWELRGNVCVRNVKGEVFKSNELFWDGISRELYSNQYSKLTTPERNLEGTYFVSDDRMSHYVITNSKGAFTRGRVGDSSKEQAAQDTLQADSSTSQIRKVQKRRAVNK